MITNFDPNLRWTEQTYEATFMQWDYVWKARATICSNSRGADLFKDAIGQIFDELADKQGTDLVTIVMDRHTGDPKEFDQLLCDLEDEDELIDLCVGITLVEVKPWVRT